jgi:hypothetical protein
MMCYGKCEAARSPQLVRQSRMHADVARLGSFDAWIDPSSAFPLRVGVEPL